MSDNYDDEYLSEDNSGKNASVHRRAVRSFERKRSAAKTAKKDLGNFLKESLEEHRQELSKELIDSMHSPNDPSVESFARRVGSEGGSFNAEDNEIITGREPWLRKMLSDREDDL